MPLTSLANMPKRVGWVRIGPQEEFCTQFALYGKLPNRLQRWILAKLTGLYIVEDPE